MSFSFILFLNNNSYRFPVEHVQTPGGQASSKAWGKFCLFDIFFGIFTIVLRCLQTQFPGGQLFWFIAAFTITLASFVMCDRFPVEHVQTPGGRASDGFTLSRLVSQDALVISDRYPDEQLQTPGGQASF